jgi:hypothetical protein
LIATEKGKAKMAREMLVAVQSGFIEDAGELVEITAGKSRISPEVLGRPGYSEFFEPDVTARGTDAERTEIRYFGRDGRLHAAVD